MPYYIQVDFFFEIREEALNVPFPFYKVKTTMCPASGSEI